MDPGGGGGLEARRLLEIAEKLLEARDLVGSKRFAERALESDPLLDGVDLTLAVVDVLLASQHRVNNQMDCYSILQLPHPSSSVSAGGGGGGGGGNNDSLAVKRSYRRLALLLNPNHNRSPLAGPALRFVLDAYAVLSDPTKKSLLDSEIHIATSHLRSNGSAEDAAPRPVRTFWTLCPSCCHVFEYDYSYLNRSLRCRTCQQPFHAGEMAAKPPLVPGTDMYYCAWGFFPLGFRGGPIFGGFPNLGAVVLPEFGDGWKPFIPINPVWGNQRGGQPDKPLNAVPVNFAAANRNDNSGKKGNVARSTPSRNKKAVAKRSVGNYSKKKSFPGVSETRNAGTEVRGARVSEAYTGTGVGISHFDIDLDATEDVLGNLHNLPFL